MQVYLPIAEVSVNAFVLLGLGGLVGILSGMFGVGGGFLMTPLLFFIGIPPAVAVATEANQIVASSFSGVSGVSFMSIACPIRAQGAVYILLRPDYQRLGVVETLLGRIGCANPIKRGAAPAVRAAPGYL